MQEPHKKKIPAQQWQAITGQLRMLRQENQELKRRLQDNDSLLPAMRSRYSMTQSSIWMPAPDDDQPQPASKSGFKDVMQEWSSQFSSKYLEKFGIANEQEANRTTELRKCSSESLELQKSKQQISQKQIIKQQSNLSNLSGLSNNRSSLNQSKKQLKSKISLTQDLHLIQSICLYGPNQDQIKQYLPQRKMFVDNRTYYCSQPNSQLYQMYGEYFYQQGKVTVRSVKDQEAITQANQFIFRKNTKKEDCNLFVFRGDQNNQTLRVGCPVLQKTNPGRWLYAFFVQFPDYEILQAESPQKTSEDKLNKSVEQDTGNLQEEVIETVLRESDRTITKNRVKTYYLKSKYTLCVFTYFPFVSWMAQILAAILDSTKMKRVELYAESNEIKDVSFRLLSKQLREHINQITKQFDTIPVSFGSEFHVTLSNFCVQFKLQQERIDQIMYSGWVHDVLKLFQKDILYDIFTNIMTEQSVCFVCENMHILSYIIFFVVCILPLPFTYPYPCISQVFSYELLESPFVVVAGINQSSKWLEQNYMYFGKKIFIDLNDQIKVRTTRKMKSIRSQKLRKIFSNAYKKIQSNNGPLPNLFKKKSNIIRPASKEENQSAFTFLNSLGLFFEEEIFHHLPNHEIIDFLKDKSDETNETSKIFNLLKEIEKYLKESRKRKQKDNFVDLLVQQQIFYVLMSTRYDLD